MRHRIGLLTALTLLLALGAGAQTPRAEANVTRATLDNGLRVVIIQDPLAPVATLETNYLAGANETPDGFPGMAHAQEHMAFRGCDGLTADQIAAIYAQLGGYMNADTQQNITQYFATVPAQDLDVALRIDAACMTGIENSQEQWDQERGAIQQEVSRDLSNPTYKFIVRLNKDLFAGTPYENDALGTTSSFQKTTAEMLKKFAGTWYAPNNAILIVTGKVDPAATLKKIKSYYGSIPHKSLPSRPEVNLKPVTAESFTLESNLPYLLTIVSYRFPGTDSPDFAAAQVLADVLASQRGNLYALVPQGKALATQFAMLETYPKASAAFALAALPASADPGPIDAAMKKIIADYVAHGVPADLVDAAKKGEIASAEFSRNSITGLASVWSQALAAEGRHSPEENVDAIRRVTVADVNRVAKKYLNDKNSILATLKPAPSPKPVKSQGFGGKESATATPTKPVKLPDWAEAAVKSLEVPQMTVHPYDTKLPNGLRLIVQPESVSRTVTVIGGIKTQDEMETPDGQEGVSDVLEGLFSYGTKTLDRLAFQKALDDIAASESAGPSFHLNVLKQYFDRGVELLADNELHPALPEKAFQVVQKQTAQFTAGQLQSPGYRFSRALIGALLPPHDPLQRETTPKTVMSLDYADLGAYYKKAYRPDLTTIVVIGDVTPEEAKKVIEKYFGSWKAEGEPPKVVLPAVPANKPSAVHVPDPRRVQDLVELSEQLEMDRFTPAYYALQVGNHVLGGGFYATRLYRELRQKAGLVYTVNDSLRASQTRASYSVTYGCDPKNVSKARVMIEQQLANMQKYNVSPAELQQAKALLLRQIPLSESSEDAVAGGFMGRAVIGLPLDEPELAAKRYFHMSADQVRAAFAKWIDPNNFVQVVRGPAPQ